MKDEDKEGGVADTSNYEPPKYVIQPAKGDKGFAMLKSHFNKGKTYFKPAIKSENHGLANLKKKRIDESVIMTYEEYLKNS